MITITLDVSFIDFIVVLMLLISASAGLHGIIESDLPNRKFMVVALFVSTIYCAARILKL